MRRNLEATALHQRIVDVEVYSTDVVPSEDQPEETELAALEEGLVGRSFASTGRYGKWMFVALNDESDDHLVLHFGMTGGLKYFKDPREEPEYDRVLFHFANGYCLAYPSMRKLGEVAVIDDVQRFVEEKALGPDALDPDFGLAAFKDIVEGRRAMVKSILMDQHTIAGIGNVYSDEILFQAGIHPRTKIDTLDEETVETLFSVMKDVLKKAIDYQAQLDQFPESFLTPHRHEGGNCPICGAGLERVQIGSRHAYYCPNRQQKKGE